MTEVNIHEVPEKALIRNRIRKLAREIINDRNIFPPARYELIEKLAHEVLIRAGVENRFLGFAMVVCGNEIWREVVAATPFNRRLLLLPQCLKNDEKCKATVDQIGLLCAGCAGCDIDQILQKAEELGYATLVAEGTTMAISLVQEGAVDAVIGVSCMSVLQKSFEPVSRSAVPVIGIPLLFEGCAQTDVDNRWLTQELFAFKDNSRYKSLSVSVIKNQVLSFFTENSLNKILGTNGDETSSIAVNSILTGGQRIRPLLSVMAYLAYNNNASSDILIQLAIIIECFHKASLIHDDIQDSDDFRYGNQTVHKLNGTAVAINTGDFLIGKGYQILGSLPINREELIACYKLVADGHVDLSYGQGADLLSFSGKKILSINELLNIFEKKTGSAIKVALLLGAVAAKAPETDISIIEKFSKYFGIAYQIKDDFDEFKDSNENASPEDYPLLISVLTQNYTDSQLKSIQILYENNNHQKISELIMASDVLVVVEKLLLEYVNKAYSELDKLENFKLKLGLYTIMGKIF